MSSAPPSASTPSRPARRTTSSRTRPRRRRSTSRSTPGSHLPSPSTPASLAAELRTSPPTSTHSPASASSTSTRSARIRPAAPGRSRLGTPSPWSTNRARRSPGPPGSTSSPSRRCSSRPELGGSAPAAELPVVDLDIGEAVDAYPPLLEERTDRFPLSGLNRQRDADGLGVVQRGQRAVEDQPLAQLWGEAHRPKAPARHLIAAPPGDDQEPGLLVGARELPHRASEQVLEAPDRVLRVEACAVVGLACDELVRGIDARQSDDVEAAGRSLTIGAERRPAGDHRLRESVHVSPMLLE